MRIYLDLNNRMFWIVLILLTRGLHTRSENLELLLLLILKGYLSITSVYDNAIHGRWKPGGGGGLAGGGEGGGVGALAFSDDFCNGRDRYNIGIENWDRKLFVGLAPPPFTTFDLIVMLMLNDEE